ncbi:hypothetical protein ABAC402_07005 [Asticcacaulis sp. AC402]|nr:hypothetical protein ABAC402_07005 [Asticcacaulis sp. AC402]
MTPVPSPLPNPYEVAAVFAASFGLFASGTLMAARLRAQTPSMAAPSPLQTFFPTTKD